MTKRKLITSLTIAGVTLFALYKVEQVLEKEYAEIPTPNHPNLENDEEEKESAVKEVVEKTVKKVKLTAKKIKIAVRRRLVRILGWCIEHNDEIEAVKSIVTLTAAAFTLKGSVARAKTPPLDPGLYDAGMRAGMRNIVSFMVDDEEGFVKGIPGCGDAVLAYKTIDESTAKLIENGKLMYKLVERGEAV